MQSVKQEGNKTSIRERPTDDEPTAKQRKLNHTSTVQSVGATLSDTIHFQENVCSRFDNSLLSDFELTLRKTNGTDRIIRLHKFVLGQSSYFLELFITCSAQTLTVNEEEERLIIQILQTMYTGTITIANTTDIVPLLLLADTYKLTKWKTMLLNHLKENMNSSNVVQCLQLSQADHYQVEDTYKKFIEKHAIEILAGTSYTGLDVDKFIRFLETVTKLDNTAEVIKAINKWTSQNGEKETARLNKKVEQVCETLKKTHRGSCIVC